MGLSFKISKKGKRYTPKGGLGVENETQNQNDNIPTAGDQQQQQPPLVVEEVEEARLQAVLRDTSAPFSSFSAKSSSLLDSEDHEVSLSVNLFPNGFNVGLPNKLIQDVPKDLLPYDCQAVSIFSDIEHERIPGNFFDDIPCKYVNGAIVCEVRDYRTSFKKGENPSSPKINKVVLRMGMEQVINDIASIADANWEYIDILKMEAQVLKALQPVLNLSPKPMLDGFEECHPTKKLNFGISQERKKRRLVGEFSQQQPLGSLAVDQRIGAEFVNGSTDSQRLPLPLPSTSGQENVIEVDPRPNARERAKAPLTQGQSKKSGQSRQKNEKENTTGGKEALPTSQVAAGLSEGLAKDRSTPTKGKGKSSVQSSSKSRMASVANITSPEVGVETVGSHANTSHESGAVTVANVLETAVPCSSVATDPVLGRLLTIKNVSERHGLHTRKHKDCWTNDKGLVYGPTSMIAFHLENAEDERGSSHYAAGPSDSSYTVKVTTLIFVNVSWVFSQGNLSKRIETTRKLILKERLHDRWTEAIIQHELPGQRHFFRNSEYAKRFAVQFVLLMAREGYSLNDELVEFEPPHFRRSTTIGRQLAVPNNGTPAAFERYPRPPTGTSSPWPSSLSRGHGNVESVLQPLRVNYLPTTQLDQVSQQWQQQKQQHSINSARIRQQLAQRKMAMGGSGLPGSPVGPAPIRPARTAGIGSVGPVDGQGRRLMSGSMVQGNGCISPMGQVAISNMPGPGVVSHQNIGQPLQMGSDQQLGNAAVLRHASPQLDSRSPLSDNRSSPNPSARSVVE